MFAEWWVARGVRPMPTAPETIAAFLAAEADDEFRPVTIGKRAAAIAASHRAQDEPNPCDSAAAATVLGRHPPRAGCGHCVTPSRSS
jgi:hypothetical protein